MRCRLHHSYDGFLQKESQTKVENERAISKSNLQIETSKSEKSNANGPLIFSCYYCDDPDTWNENLNEIFNHWTISHSASSFLFHIIHEFNNPFNSFKFITLTNIQLKKLLSIKIPWKQIDTTNYQSNLAFEKAEHFSDRLRHLFCGQCEIRLNEDEYLEHIEMHANELKGENDLKTRLKSIHSNTKVIFVNGLVLTKHNLSTTYLGDNGMFDKYINKFLNTTTEAVLSSTSDSHPSNRLSTELSKQMARNNTLCIMNILQRNGENLKEIFARVCQKLRVPIIYEVDILEIFRASPKVIGVKFNDIKKKEEILNCDRAKYLITHEILEDEPRNQSKQIVFNNHVTKFYEGIERHLRSAQIQGKIHAFELTKDGFKFKKTVNGVARSVFSIDGFEKIVDDKQ